MSTTLSDLLNLPRFYDLKLLTKQANVDCPIENVEISETPDIEFHISNRALLLTTAMFFQDNQSDFIPFIDSLIRANVVGLAIKTERFIETLDHNVIEYANSREFPIIHIPDNFSLGNLLYQILNLLWSGQYDDISLALDIQKQFSRLVAKNASNDAIINKLRLIVKSPIVLLNPFNEIISHSQEPNFSRNWAELVTNATLRSKQDSTNDEGTFLINTSKIQVSTVWLKKINVHHYFPHYLLILKPVQTIYPISSLAFEQASMVLAFNLFKNESIEDTKRLNELEVFRTVIDMSNYPHETHDIARLTDRYSYTLSTYYRVIEVVLAPSDHHQLNNTLKKEQLKLAGQWLRKHMEEYVPNTLTFYYPNSNHLYILLQYNPGNIEEVLTQVHQQFSQSINIDLHFHLGEAFSDLTQVGQSYQQATSLRRNKTQATNNGFIYYFNASGYNNLFQQLNSRDITFFCQSTLKELAFPTDLNMKDFRETLHVFLDLQCKIEATANQLFIHRNTVKYRIQRCEEIVGVDVTDSHHSLNLRIALELSDHLQS